MINKLPNELYIDVLRFADTIKPWDRQSRHILSTSNFCISRLSEKYSSVFFKHLLSTKSDYEIKWILQNIMKRLDKFQNNLHLILVDLYGSRRFDLMDYVISVIHANTKSWTTLWFANGAWNTGYDFDYIKAHIGITSGQVALLEYLVPHIIVRCSNNSELYQKLSCLDADADAPRLRGRHNFGSFEMFKYVLENKIFDIMNDSWHLFSELPKIAQYIKNNNISYDISEYLPSAIEDISLSSSIYDHKNDISELQSVLQNLQIDINLLPIQDVIYTVALTVGEGALEQRIIGSSVHKTAIEDEDKTLSKTITTLLRLGLTLDRLAEYIIYLNTHDDDDM